MLICLPLACVWPRSAGNYSCLALTRKLIMKDNQSSTCRLPKCHIKFLPLSKELQVLGVGALVALLHLHCLFPTFDTEKPEQGKMKVGGFKKKKELPASGGDFARFHQSLHHRSPHWLPSRRCCRLCG